MYMPPTRNIQPYEDLIMQEAKQRQKQLTNQQLMPLERSMSRGKYLLSLGLVALSQSALFHLQPFPFCLYTILE